MYFAECKTTGLKYEALLSHMMYLSHRDEVIAVLDQVLLLWQQAAVLGVCVCVTSVWAELFRPLCWQQIFLSIWKGGLDDNQHLISLQ